MISAPGESPSDDQPRENPPPSLTATVEVIRDIEDMRGIITDLALKGEAHVRADALTARFVLAFDTRPALGVRDASAYHPG